MKKIVLGFVAGLVTAISASAAAYAFPDQLSGTFSAGQTLLASSLEEMRQAANVMLRAFGPDGRVLPSMVATGASADFVSSAERSAWNAKLAASSVGVSVASLSGGLVPLAQLPPVFDSSGLNVLAASVATNAGARFVSDAEKAAWGAKLDSSSTIPAANVLTGSAARFVSDSQVAAWNAKLDASAVGATVAPLSGGLVPSQFLPGAFTVATQAEAEAGTDNSKSMTPLRVAQHYAANRATAAEISSGSSAAHYVTAYDLNRYAVGTMGPGESYEYVVKDFGGPVSVSEDAYTKKYEYQVRRSGTYKFRIQIRAYGMSNYGGICARIYKNGAAYGTERCLGNTYDSTATSDESLAFSAGDYVQLFAKETTPYAYTSYVNTFKALVEYTPAEVRVLRDEF